MIRVTDDFVIDVTVHGYNVMLDKHKVNKKGESVYETLGCHGNLKAALGSVLKHLNRMKLSEGTHSLKEAIEIVTRNHELLQEILKEVKEEI